MKIIEFLKLSDWGNLLGILSIAIGVISLWLSVRTLRTAKKIDEQIKKERIDAVAKNAFNEQRQELEENILLLEKKLIETDGLEYQLAKQVFNIICRAGSHKGIFNVEDQKKLDELKGKKDAIFTGYAEKNKVVRQLVDLALLQIPSITCANTV